MPSQAVWLDSSRLLRGLELTGVILRVCGSVVAVVPAVQPQTLRSFLFLIHAALWGAVGRGVACAQLLFLHRSKDANGLMH
eukprot:scaffold90686_cov23-Tisochrysis_lutea.AAC.1